MEYFPEKVKTNTDFLHEKTIVPFIDVDKFRELED